MDADGEKRQSAGAVQDAGALNERATDGRVFGNSLILVSDDGTHGGPSRTGDAPYPLHESACF